jgi:predicted component of type VI protein secretion system
VNYGLPDFTTLNPTSEGDRQRLGRLIVEAVRAFEPRLRNPLVEVKAMWQTAASCASASTACWSWSISRSRCRFRW